MDTEFILAAIVGTFLFIYLVYSVVYPEKF